MPDCSYVTVTIANRHVSEQLRRLLDTATHWNTEVPAGDDATTWEADDEAWGADNQHLRALYDWLVAARIPFRASDGGHYMWAPFEVGYDGQMEAWVMRSAQIDAGAALSGHELAAIAELEPEAFKTAVLAHFGDDPAGWAAAHVAP